MDTVEHWNDAIEAAIRLVKRYYGEMILTDEEAAALRVARALLALAEGVEGRAAPRPPTP